MGLSMEEACDSLSIPTNSNGAREGATTLMKFNAIVTARLFWEGGQEAAQRLRDAGIVLMEPCVDEPLEGDRLVSALRDADAVIASTERYTSDVLKQLPRLKIIARWGVGYDSIDLDAATQLGIVVTNTPGLVTEAVADLTIALMLAIARRIVDAVVAMREGSWRAYRGVSVWGKTLGIIGCGRIGTAVARRAIGFGMKVLGYDIRPSDEARAVGIEFVTLEELLRSADYVSLNAALTQENRGLIGERELRMMKPTAFLINTARGPLVDEDALIRALREGWIAGAALDVYAVEPLPREHPLRTLPNCICTPHMATTELETAIQVSNCVAQCLLDALNGRIPKYVVNTEVVGSENLRIR